jgi:NAD(P)-dependent dehydrogenase (short-subunit alcohol dehydrogenase family)
MICSCGSVGFSTGRDDPSDLARDVVNRDEQAYAELAKNVPIGRAGSPEEIASVVLWLCSSGASYLVGHALPVDGGMTVP